jgi:hypothetical protein
LELRRSQTQGKKERQKGASANSMAYRGNNFEIDPPKMKVTTLFLLIARHASHLSYHYIWTAYTTMPQSTTYRLDKHDTISFFSTILHVDIGPKGSN